jgi:FtsH-binding integral membrane protein
MAVRIVLTLILIALSYRETGIFTALSLALIFIGMEISGWLTKRALDELRDLKNSDSFTNPAATRK